MVGGKRERKQRGLFSRRKISKMLGTVQLDEIFELFVWVSVKLGRPPKDLVGVLLIKKTPR